MKSLLITGGTGTLGHAIVTKLLNYKKPRFSKIIIYSRDEQKQNTMSHLFSSHKNFKRLRFIIGDIRDKDRLYVALNNNVTHVIHAAALKIVPACEYNPFEAVKTNILGTQNLIECCTLLGAQVKKVVVVSTDKAVHPINLYGATKLAMEKLSLAANNIQGLRGPVYGVVRYGNVTGSRGSVAHVFKESLEKNPNAPLGLTHADATRFWITASEAADFVISATEKIKHGANNLFIPKMKAYLVAELAYAIALNKNITLKFKAIGLRPGEKIHEDMATNVELPDQPWSVYPTSFAAPKMTIKELQAALAKEGF